MARKASKEKKTFSGSYLEKLETQIQSNQSKVSMILGALIILVVGILVFNYFNKNKADIGPSQQTQEDQQQDVSPDKLPGKYTVKEGDTLFTIAETYYQDGYKYTEIAKANNLEDPNQVANGQVLEIPKLETTQQAQASAQPSAQTSASSSAAPTESEELGTGGGNTTIWGTRIEGTTYTVAEGDWLSTIAGRAYGDVLAYKRLAEANKISNPDHIEPGLVLTIPR